MPATAMPRVHSHNRTTRSGVAEKGARCTLPPPAGARNIPAASSRLVQPKKRSKRPAARDLDREVSGKGHCTQKRRLMACARQYSSLDMATWAPVVHRDAGGVMHANSLARRLEGVSHTRRR